MAGLCRALATSGTGWAGHWRRRLLYSRTLSAAESQEPRNPGPGVTRRILQSVDTGCDFISRSYYPHSRYQELRLLGETKMHI